MTIFSHYPLRRPRGFSLVEIMVALLIGMIAMIVVLQIYSVSEANKRTTTGSDDAQISGVLGLFALQRDIRQSGYGINAYNLLGCSVTLRPGVVLPTLAPVVINPVSTTGGPLFTGQDANTDTLLVVYGNGNTITEGSKISLPNAGANVTSYQLPSLLGVYTGDWAIAIPATPPVPCNLSLDQVVNSPSFNAYTVDMATGGASNINGYFYDLGQSPTIVAYAVRNGSLTKCDYMVNDCSQNTAANWTPIAGNIVGMLAQYGRDDTSSDTSPGTMTGIVSAYDTTVQAPPSVNSTQCGWARIASIRLALLAQNGQYDKSNPPVTSAVPTWEGSATNNPPGISSTARPFNLSGFNPAVGSWQNYRYKVYQTTVPIKNVSWLYMGGQSGC